jgi:hypothetical protein
MIMVTVTTMKTKVAIQREGMTTVKAAIILAQTTAKPTLVQVHSLIHRTLAPEKDI